MEQVVLKPKNLATSSEVQVKPIQILRCSEAAPVDMESEDAPLSNVIQATYDSLGESDPVATVSQMLRDDVRHSQEVSLSNCTLENNHLFHKNCLWIPENANLHLHLFQEAHNQAMAGHTGIAKTHNLLSCWYYWPRMVNTIWQYIRNCHVCSQAKLACDHQGELLSLPIPQQCWQDLAMDFITDLPESTDICFPGTKHIWVITDHLTKEHHFVPCAEMTTSHLFWMFIQSVVHIHGLPRSIVSDRGGQFVSSFWKALCTQLNITLQLSSEHHPETDG